MVARVYSEGWSRVSSRVTRWMNATETAWRSIPSISSRMAANASCGAPARVSRTTRVPGQVAHHTMPILGGGDHGEVERRQGDVVVEVLGQVADAHVVVAAGRAVEVAFGAKEVAFEPELAEAD